MSSSQGYSSDRSRDERITLPPIRDILREELSSSPKASSRSLNASFALGPLSSALCEGSNPRMSPSNRLPSMSPEMGYARRGRTWENIPFPRNTAEALPASSSPRSFGAPRSPGVSTRRSVPENSASRRPTSGMRMPQPHPDEDYHRSKPSPLSSGTPGFRITHSSPSGPHRVHESSRAHALSDWERHKRRDSSDSAWSRHSTSSDTSSHVHSLPMSNALQFQPLPHAQMTSPFPRPPNNATPGAQPPTPPPPAEYQSPFGVLIADVGPHSVPPADPQRMAILRTLRASGQQGSFPVNFDDAINVHSARYECQYCGKRFNRPSSLKIHIHSHTGEKPFECSHRGCERRFSVQSNMRRHARVHENGAEKGGASSGEEQTNEASSRSRTPLSSSQH